MALVPHTFFPRRDFDTDLWHRPQETGPRALDVFDPFDELDMQLNSMVNWLERPPAQIMPQPKVPQKYRVTMECAGFDTKSIKCEIVAGDKLVVTCTEGDEFKSGSEEDHWHCSFKRTFELPKLTLLDAEKMTSFMTSQGTLVIDIPYRMDESGMTAEDLWPKVVESADGHKVVSLDMHLPRHIDPSKVHVTAKDRDVIVKAEDKAEWPHGFAKFHFYRRSTMPQSTDMRELKCTWEDNKLSIRAPLKDQHHSHHHHHSKMSDLVHKLTHLGHHKKHPHGNEQQQNETKKRNAA